MNAWTRLVAGLLDRGATDRAVVVGMALVAANKLWNVDRATLARYNAVPRLAQMRASTSPSDAAWVERLLQERPRARLDRNAAN